MIEIRTFQQADFPAVMDIYRQGIATGMATFETEVKQWEQWDESVHAECRLVAIDGESVVGWAALMPVSARNVYRGVAEETIYVANTSRGHGVGKRLMRALIESSEAAGFWTLQGVIFEQNTASIRLHERHGFRRVGRREKIGQLDGRWCDTLLYERRSTVVGQAGDTAQQSSFIREAST